MIELGVVVANDDGDDLLGGGNVVRCEKGLVGWYVVVGGLFGDDDGWVLSRTRSGTRTMALLAEQHARCMCL